jgi:hypothetical protein
MSKKQLSASLAGVGDKTPPFETKSLRDELKKFLDAPWPFPLSPQQPMKVGDFKFGVYAFYDYDGEPIYVGQTNEKLRTRIRRHLTNQRTDAVAMNVLDPFEVCEVCVWPLFKHQYANSKDANAARDLNELEGAVYFKLIDESAFNAVLNEVAPKKPPPSIKCPDAFRGKVVAESVRAIRGHPDVRIARRALVISRLAQVISERQVKPGLRRTLLVQAKRLQWLASERLKALEPPGKMPETKA